MNATTLRGLRAVSLTLALAFTFTAGLLFQTQTGAYAFTKGRIPVTLSPSAAAAILGKAQTVLPAAGTAGAAILGTAAAGLAGGAAIGSAAVCAFSDLPCLLPSWGQAPNVPPNNDQTATPTQALPQAETCTTAWGFSGVLAPCYTVVYQRPKGYWAQVVIATWTHADGQQTVKLAQQGSANNDPTSPSGPCGTSSSYTSGTGTVKHHRGSGGTTYSGPTSIPSTATMTRVYTIQTPCGDPSINGYGTTPDQDSAASGAAPDPLRYAQAWKRCGELNPLSTSFVNAVAQAVAYRESQATGSREPMPVPNCPPSHPVPHRIGVGTTTGTPLAPATYPDTQAMPDTARGVPPITYPNPDVYPECPTPGSCPVGRPDTGTPLLPLPSPPNPDGSPALNPDGSPKTEPVPTVAPGDAPCAWGPYAVPEADCVAVDAPQKEPSTDQQTGIDPAPAPQTDPAGCLSRSVSWNPITWIFEPVKCALKWGFEISPETRTKWSTAGDLAATKPPVSLVGGLGDFAAPFGALGMNCPDWKVKVSGLEQNVVCGQGYTERLHDWRDLTGAALLALAVMPFLWRVWHAGIPILNVQPHR